MTNSIFIDANTNLKIGSDRYEHFISLSKKELSERWLTPEALELIESLEKNKFGSDVLKEKIGKLNDKFDLRGINLSNKILSGINLSNIDFYAANFSNSNLSGSNLNGSYLSEANLIGTNFSWSSMEDALIDNVEFDNSTNFLGVALNKANLSFAVLVYDLALTQQRIAQLEKSHVILSRILKLTTDYGRSLSRWLTWCLIVIFVFAFLYCFVPGATNNQSFGNSLYFSIVTFTTLGYGDIVPIGFGKFLSAFEVLTGLLMGGLLVAILTKKMLV